MTVRLAQEAPGTSGYPAWMREPAKLVGWVVAAVLAVAGLVVAVGGAVTDVLPEKWRAPVLAAVGIATTVSIVATRVQALLTRNGIGPAGNGKDGVFSPATIDAARAQAHTGQPVTAGHVDVGAVAGLPELS